MSQLTDQALIIATSAVAVTAVVPPMLDRTKAYLESTTAQLSAIECRAPEPAPQMPLYTIDGPGS